jgi:AcrR family transcriptional regulator
MPRAAKKPPRRRRDAASAREAILDVAEQQLVVTGPSGIRLQEVAKEAGVSHPTVLHHFGSREALVKAVCTRAIRAIHIGLVEGIAASTGEEDQLTGMLDAVAHALNKSGHARVVMWLALEGHSLEGSDVRLDQVIAATHELRKTRLRAGGTRRAPPIEDTAHTVVLAALALIGSAVIGPALFANAGLGTDGASEKRFRGWLAKMLRRHLESAD